jgi:hypothetical protein
MSQKPKPTAADVKMFIAIGGVAVTWGHLEFALSALLAELMEINVETAFILSAALDYRHHRDLISSLSDLKLKGHPKTAGKVRAFLSEMRGMNTERNSTIHAIWHQEPGTNRNRRLTMRNQGDMKMEFRRVSSRHMFTVAKKISALSVEALTLRAEIRDAVASWREKFVRLDWPLLDVEIEAHSPPATPRKR